VVAAQCQGRLSERLSLPEKKTDIYRTGAHTLWGAALPYYFIVSKLIEAGTISLKEAVANIEASPADDRFLIVAYQDGGLITVSAAALPFQLGARKADWWRPYKFASRSLR
jgi:hypothetical protein